MGVRRGRRGSVGDWGWGGVGWGSCGCLEMGGRGEGEVGGGGRGGGRGFVEVVGGGVGGVGALRSLGGGEATSEIGDRNQVGWEGWLVEDRWRGGGGGAWGSRSRSGCKGGPGWLGRCRRQPRTSQVQRSGP